MAHETPVRLAPDDLAISLLLHQGVLLDPCGSDGALAVQTTLCATAEAWWYEQRVLDRQHLDVVPPIREDSSALLKGQPVTQAQRRAWATKALHTHQALCARVEAASAAAPPGRRRRTCLWASVACLAVLGLAGGWYHLTRPGPPPRLMASVARPAPEPALAALPSMVRVGTFWIDRAEVSIQDYQQVVPTYKVPYGFTPLMPVVNVTWEAANAYAQRQGKRLCTVQEWREAFVGPVSLNDVALGRAMDAGPRAAHDVQERNRLGLVNMLGNVSEWLASRDGVAPYIGASWYTDLDQSEASLLVRTLATQQAAQRHIGFRLCRNAP